MITDSPADTPYAQNAAPREASVRPSPLMDPVTTAVSATGGSTTTLIAPTRADTSTRPGTPTSTFAVYAEPSKPNRLASIVPTIAPETSRIPVIRPPTPNP